MEWEGLKARLAEYGQEHLLGYLGELNELQKKALYQDIHTIDLKKITKCWKEAKKSLSDSEEMKDDQLKPLPSSIVGSTTDSREEVDRWKDMGMLQADQLGDLAVTLSSFCLKVSRRSLKGKLQYYFWLGVKEHGWVCPTPRACSMLVYRLKKPFTSFRQRESFVFRIWLIRNMENQQ